jgi:hypothetical protein
VAVEHIPPAGVVFGRTLLGAVFLVPPAARRRAFRGLRQVIGPERLTAGAVGGLVLIALGAWLATSKRAS